MIIIDCPIHDKRTAPPPKGHLASIFGHEWWAGRKKNGSINYKGQHTFRLDVDEDRIRDQCAWAVASALLYGHALDAITLNWETLPAVPSRNVLEGYRWDDGFALARTLDLMRECVPGVRIDVFGIRPWIMHRHYIKPSRLWEIYRECGVRMDSVITSAVGKSPELTASIIKTKQTELDMYAPDATLSILTRGNNPKQSAVVAESGLTEIRWYPRVA